MTAHAPLGWKKRLWTLLRSSAVGVIATLSDLSTLLLLVYVGGLREDVANIPSLLPGLLVMFFGNKYFAFADRSRQVLQQGGRFLFVEAWAFVLNALLFHLLVREASVPFLAARLMGTAVVYLAFSFPLWTFIFRPQAGVRSQGSGVTQTEPSLALRACVLTPDS